MIDNEPESSLAGSYDTPRAASWRGWSHWAKDPYVAIAGDAEERVAGARHLLGCRQ